MTRRRVASVIRLRPDAEADYREMHAAVSPGLLDALRRAHITNYSIFLRDGTLFSYLEYVGEEYETDLARLAANETTRLWWQLTDPCQEPLETTAPHEWWAPAEELFHLD